MKYSFLLFFSCLANPSFCQILTDNWKFAKGSHPDAMYPNFNDADWQTVRVPHDWSISGPFIVGGDGNTAKLPWKGEGWYRYTWQETNRVAGGKLFLLFDGVMAFPKIYINGKLAGQWDYGYNSFYLDVTDLVQYNASNTLAVHVDTRIHDSRWYPGAGIYRKVQLIRKQDVHIPIWGQQVTTPIIKPNYAKVNVITPVMNDADEAIEVRVINIISNGITPIITDTVKQKVAANSSITIERTYTLTDPRRWDIDDPHLYNLRTELFAEGQLRYFDFTHVPFGIRTMRFTADDGFYLNDRRVQIKGVNLHHDLGPLGGAFDVQAMARQLKLLQEMGCNAVRNSHNVAAPELLELCDNMGILVLNEIFDKYDKKADITDTTNFNSFAERNMRNFIMRDRNHPSIFLWSVGNEIGDVQWNVNGGFEKLRTMVNLVRKYDSTRPVTLVCDSRNSATLRHFDFYDVHSWNYGRRYDLARQLEPNKAVIISESASTVSTRGFYELPLPAVKTDFTKSLQVSSYDLNAPEWAEIADDDFMWQQDEPYVAGEFVWTGFDYLGEPTPYDPASMKKAGMSDSLTSVSSYFGIFDLVGLPKDRYYLYKSYWNQKDTTIHILPHWNWQGKEGQTIPVFVYTNGDCAELFLNGVSQGKQCKKPDSQKSTERFRLMWNDVKYKAGELTAVAYKEGQKLGTATLKTTGPPTVLKLTAEENYMFGHGLGFIKVEAVDKDGNPHPLADNTVTVAIDGPAVIAGVGNGNPQSIDPFQSYQVKLFNGKAMIYLRSTSDRGEVKVSVSAKGLKGDDVLLAIHSVSVR
jgi:beta-galactosidase